MDSLTQCSICLADSSGLEPIYSIDKSTALDVYLLTGVIIIEIKDKKSAMICKSCLVDLSIAKKFRDRCKKSEILLKKSYKKVETKMLEELRKNIFTEKEINDIVVKVEQPKSEDEYAESIGLDPEVCIEEEDDSIWNNVPDFTTKPQKLPKNLVSCSYCSKTMNEKSLKYHIQIKHEKSPDLKYKCDICGRGFNLSYALKRHILRVHEKSGLPRIRDESERRTCTICNAVLNTKLSYNNHMRYIHPPGGPQECPCSICGRVFKNSHYLYQHEKTHKFVPPSEHFFCDLCGNKFKYKAFLKIHIRDRHIQKIRYQCELCPSSYASINTLKKHVDYRHKNIQDWVCKWCGKGFSEKRKLVVHERIHTGEQPYHCKVCDTKFTHQTDYRRHTWIHEGRKGFKCRICSEAFFKRSELNSHRKHFHFMT